MKKLPIFTTAGVLLGTCIALSFQSHFWSEGYARQRAFERIAAYDSRVSGPSALKKVDAGNAVWAFEWPQDHSRSKKVVGAWISRTGAVEIYTGDTSDPASAAYERR